MAAAVDPGRAVQWAREPDYTTNLVARLEQLPPARALALLETVVGKSAAVKEQRAVDLGAVSQLLFLDGGSEAKRGRLERSVHTRLLKLGTEHRRALRDLEDEPSGASREAKLAELREAQPWFDSLSFIFDRGEDSDEDDPDDDEENESFDDDSMSGVEYPNAGSQSSGDRSPPRRSQPSRARRRSSAANEHGGSHASSSQSQQQMEEDILSACPKCGEHLSANSAEAEAHLAGCFPSAARAAEESICPVCELDLGAFEADVREGHVAECCSRGTGSAQMGVVGAREFVVFSCDEASKPREGGECAVCYDEFELGASLVRLSCYCVYHEQCARTWWEGKEGRFCPLHRAMNEGDNSMAMS